jgi:hypothetical protein
MDSQSWALSAIPATHTRAKLKGGPKAAFQFTHCSWS